jgi:hypothetical protein
MVCNPTVSNREEDPTRSALAILLALEKGCCRCKFCSMDQEMENLRVRGIKRRHGVPERRKDAFYTISYHTNTLRWSEIISADSITLAGFQMNQMVEVASANVGGKILNDVYQVRQRPLV